MVSPLRGGAHPLAQPAAELVKKSSKKLVNLRFLTTALIMDVQAIARKII